MAKQEISKEYFYPKDLKKNDKYKYRHVLISVMKNNAVESATKALFNAVSKMKFLTDFGTVPISQDLKNLIDNYNKSNKQAQGETVCVIGLPLPNSFSDSQTHEWGVEEGPIGSKLRALTKSDVGGSIGKILGGSIGKKILGNTSFDTVAGSIASKLGARKPLADPGYFQNYAGTQPRDFQMSFDFVPNNQEEALQMIEIVMALKRFSSPTRKAGVSLLAPHFFNIKLSNDDISGMVAISDVVLKSISLDYGADGAMQQTFDGIPKHIKMDLTFGEKEFKSYEDWVHKPNPKKEKARKERLGNGFRGIGGN